jgi:hypothetical protein
MAHSAPAELSESSARMLGKAAMIAVLFAPTASIAKHDDHWIDACPARVSCPARTTIPATSCLRISRASEAGIPRQRKDLAAQAKIL